MMLILMTAIKQYWSFKWCLLVRPWWRKPRGWVSSRGSLIARYNCQNEAEWDIYRWQFSFFFSFSHFCISRYRWQFSFFFSFSHFRISRCTGVKHTVGRLSCFHPRLQLRSCRPGHLCRGQAGSQKVALILWTIPETLKQVACSSTAWRWSIFIERDNSGTDNEHLARWIFFTNLAGNILWGRNSC